MVLRSETANTVVFLYNFNSLYLLYLGKRKEMEIVWLANANKHFKKLHAGS